jgi:ArsR family transcriptional regulator
MQTQTAPDLTQVARWFHALSDETRLRIVGMLADGEHCVCDLTDALDAAQSRLSFHLKTLKTAGVVRDRKEGRWVYYSLNPEVLGAMADFAAQARPAQGVGECGCG